MCVVSMIVDHGIERMKYWTTPSTTTNPVFYPSTDTLKELGFTISELMRKAKAYDEEHGEPDCELDEKKETLQKLADQLGVKITFP